MTHARQATILGATLAHSSLSPKAIGEYYVDNWLVISVHPGDHCRLDWYDPKQPHLF